MSSLPHKSISTNQVKFIQGALLDNIRVDGRKLNDPRRTNIKFEEQWGVVRTTIGDTVVLTSITAEIVEPSQDKPSNGIISCKVDFSTMASPYFTTRPDAGSLEISRTIERVIKDSGCIETETLCILPRLNVWSLSINICVLNYGGNIIDVCCLGALAALMYFRKPEVSVTSQGISLYNENERNFVPLHINSYPITTTFALIDCDRNNTISVLDPSYDEDIISNGYMTITCTPQQEVLNINSVSSHGQTSEMILRNANLSIQRAQIIYAYLKQELNTKLEERFKQSIRSKVVGKWEKPQQPSIAE